MKTNKVLDDFFPLKDIRVRGDLIAAQEYYKNNLTTIQRAMLDLRELFGVRVYDRFGNKVYLEIWNVGKQQLNSATQIRWFMTVGHNKKKVITTVSLAESLSKKRSNAAMIIEMLKSVENLPIYNEIHEVEKYRVQLNLRNKITLKLMQHLAEIETALNTNSILDTFGQTHKMPLTEAKPEQNGLFDYP